MFQCLSQHVSTNPPKGIPLLRPAWTPQQLEIAQQLTELNHTEPT